MAPAAGPIPVSLGHYVIEGELGRGGMGVVYLARDGKLERHVAIKTLPAVLAQDAEQLALFEREAKLLASLNHPNIATIHGLEVAEDQTRYLILERVEGETLADRLTHGALPLDEALKVCGQIAEALEAAHERGVIHRDLKPRNVMLTHGGRVKVLDFGLAKRTEMKHAGPGAAASLATDHGMVVGTPGYMSPEQVLAQPQDIRTDLFAFGCVLYECLAGRKTFEADTAAGLFAAVLKTEPDWSALPAETPPGIRDLLAACLKKDRDHRPGDTTRVRAAVHEVLRDHQAGATRAAVGITATPNNLPRELASFVGRERELSECGQLLENTRLLTLTGAGGSGKTRLALRLGEGRLDQHPYGVWFVDLAPLADAARVPHTVASALQMPDEPGKTLEQALAERLDQGPSLLILDNCEHLLAASATLAGTLLAACRHLKVIATSREGLGVAGEQVYAVPTLTVPGRSEGRTAEAAQAFEAVRLFVARAVQVQPGFELTDANAAVVSEISRRLDGIPLAIELAAARVKVLAVEQIRAKLDDMFRLLTGGSKAALARHQTLRATIQWSYDHLHEDEQRLLRTLAVFAGGWTLEAATSLYGVLDDEFEVLDLTTRLVDKSLVVVDRVRGGESRYRYLETVRQYALEKLNEAGEGEAARDRHEKYFLKFAEQAEPRLTGPEQAAWVTQLTAEHENLLAALEWCQGAEGDLSLVSSLWRYWIMRGHLALGRGLLEQALAESGTKQSPLRARARALYGLAALAYSQGDYAAASKSFNQALVAFLEEGNQERVAASLSGLGNIANDQADYAAAKPYYEQALTICKEIGEKRGTANNLHNLGVVALRQGELNAARALFDEAGATLRQMGDKNNLSITLGNLGMLSMRLGDAAATRQYLAEGFKLIQELGSKRPSGLSLEVAAQLADALVQPTRAASLLGAAAALREAIGMPQEPSERKAQEAVVTRVREELGEEGFARAYENGRAMSFEAAIEGALAWLEERVEVAKGG